MKLASTALEIVVTTRTYTRGDTWCTLPVLVNFDLRAPEFTIVNQQLVHISEGARIRNVRK